MALHEGLCGRAWAIKEKLLITVLNAPKSNCCFQDKHFHSPYMLIVSTSYWRTEKLRENRPLLTFFLAATAAKEKDIVGYIEYRNLYPEIIS